MSSLAIAVSMLDARIRILEGTFAEATKRSAALERRIDASIERAAHEKVVVDVMEAAWRADRKCACFLYCSMKSFFADSAAVLRASTLASRERSCSRLVDHALREGNNGPMFTLLSNQLGVTSADLPIIAHIGRVVNWDAAFRRHVNRYGQEEAWAAARKLRAVLSGSDDRTAGTVRVVLAMVNREIDKYDLEISEMLTRCHISEQL